MTSTEIPPWPRCAAWQILRFWLDPAVDPNGRIPGTCFMGDPRSVNDAPAGLARFCTLRSWLSQWSYDKSRADGPAAAARISVPAMVLENTADDACAPSHTRRIHEGIASADKTLIHIQDANHYYFGQPDRLAEAVAAVGGWLADRGLAARQPGTSTPGN